MTAAARSGARAAGTSAEARGKINLGLAVIARRGDGFHQIETLFARLLLADLLEVEVLEGASGIDLELSGAPDTGAPDTGAPGTGAPVLPSGADNLAVRAAQAYLGTWQRVNTRAAPGLRLKLTKVIPVAAGLGGGSADAGAVLRALAELLPIGAAVASEVSGQATKAGHWPSNQGSSALDAGSPGESSQTVMRLAAQLGSDVPFFASGLAAAAASGRGERLKPAEVPRLAVVLAKPAFAVSAAEAYQALVGFTPRLKSDQALAALARGEEPRWSNALQPGVLRMRPEVREVLEALRQAGLKGVLMSGSGPTCFGVAAGPLEAAAAAAGIKASRPDWWVAASATG